MHVAPADPTSPSSDPAHPEPSCSSLLHTHHYPFFCSDETSSGTQGHRDTPPSRPWHILLLQNLPQHVTSPPTAVPFPPHSLPLTTSCSFHSSAQSSPHPFRESSLTPQWDRCPSGLLPWACPFLHLAHATLLPICWMDPLSRLRLPRKLAGVTPMHLASGTNVP